MTSNWTLNTSAPELQLLMAAIAAIFLAGIAAGILTRVLRSASSGLPFFNELLNNTASIIHVLLPLMALQAVLTAADDDLLLIGGIRHIAALGVIAAFTWLGLRAVKAIEKTILQHNPLDITDNLRARQVQTQTRVLVRTLGILVLTIGAAAMLMTFPAARQIGASLLASAGLAGLAVGFAAKPVLGNLIAGLQIAIAQPIRLDDVVIVENEWGRVEEITGTYVVLRIWDSRRLVIPLQWFIEHPFQNWTRKTSSLLGSVIIWVDYSTPLEPLRAEAKRLCAEAGHLWDGEVCSLQITDCNDRAMQLRILASSGDSPRNWELRCYLRENVLIWLNRNYPDALPELRVSLTPRQSCPDEELPPRQTIGGGQRQPPV